MYNLKFTRFQILIVEFYINLDECTVNGEAGDGTEQGTCAWLNIDGLVCHADGTCKTAGLLFRHNIHCPQDKE